VTNRRIPVTTGKADILGGYDGSPNGCANRWQMADGTWRGARSNRFHLPSTIFHIERKYL
jgi:hypothetical protein